MEDLCLISKVEYDENSIRPVIVNFENGRLQEGQENKLVCQMYQDDKENRILVAAAEENDLIYSGSINRSDLYNTFIGVRNKKKNKMSLIAVDYAILSPKFQEQEPHNITTTDSKNVSELYKEFGSKKAKRLTEQRERMRMDVENVKEQLEQTVADIKVSAQDMTTPTINENSSSYRPPINRDAVTVEEVYSLDDIVSSNVLGMLSEEVNRILENEMEGANLTAFVTYRMKNPSKSSSLRKEVKYQLLLYIDCLIKFMNKTAREISVRKCSLCPYSEIVHQDILEKYTIVSGKSRLRPNTMRDKCMCSILVLSMIACDYKIDLEMLSKELKLGLRRMQDISRILAFNVSKTVATLSLPLPAPVSINKKDRKRKSI